MPWLRTMSLQTLSEASLWHRKGGGVRQAPTRVVACALVLQYGWRAARCTGRLSSPLALACVSGRPAHARVACSRPPQPPPPERPTHSPHNKAAPHHPNPTCSRSCFRGAPWLCRRQQWRQRGAAAAQGAPGGGARKAGAAHAEGQGAARQAAGAGAAGGRAAQGGWAGVGAWPWSKGCRGRRAEQRVRRGIDCKLCKLLARAGGWDPRQRL